ncbi:DUF1330 domain-containing protein [Streptomyces sp. NA04227]|uniref:DUF1330 domain-containing protein n=1 Tax=Streptomyces sp. NA04227 TaxID=2742136 RepID=UPI00159028EB|nr:DUF1330 domain-containing protein [Streptomyces sp. NA04227]QKW06593.1 DUF1330 domain-containing protein [Streptomyces sp. NA04227]
MTAYAIAHIRPDARNDEVIEYIDRIQATLDPYDGRFLVHGAEVEVVEGPWPGTIVVIGFPDIRAAREWYGSEAYQEILPLRTRNVPGEAILVDGVPADYDARRTAAALREARTEGR